MERRHVGSSGLQVSSLGLGTMTWGGHTTVDDARAMLRMFVDAGGDLVDTAPAYGGGRAELLIGEMLASEIRREDLVISTKVGFRSHNDQQRVDSSKRAILDDLAQSLKRLRTDHVDIVQVHAWGDAPVDETLAALDHAVSSGMALYAGVSNYIGWQIGTTAAWQRALPGRARLVSAQIEYSLLARRAEVEVVPALTHHEMSLFPWSPLGRGVLTGKYRHGVPRDSRGAMDQMSWFVEPYFDARSSAVVDAVETAATGLNLTAAQVALMWVRDAPSVAAPLLGCRTSQQLSELLATPDAPLPTMVTSALDDVTGGPHAGREEAVNR